MGAMQLFAACQKAPSVRRVILKSTSEVYGSHPHDPVVYAEDRSARRPPRRASPATASTSRATPAGWAGAGPTSR